MSDIERMNAYIERTKMGNTRRYAMKFQEMDELYQMIEAGRSFEAIIKAYNYGRAKGYRMAKKNEVRRG